MYLPDLRGAEGTGLQRYHDRDPAKRESPRSFRLELPKLGPFTRGVPFSGTVLGRFAAFVLGRLTGGLQSESVRTKTPNQVATMRGGQRRRGSSTHLATQNLPSSKARSTACPASSLA